MVADCQRETSSNNLTKKKTWISQRIKVVRNYFAKDRHVFKTGD